MGCPFPETSQPHLEDLRRDLLFLRRSPSQPQLLQNFGILFLIPGFWLFLELLLPPHGAPTSLIRGESADLPGHFRLIIIYSVPWQ